MINLNNKGIVTNKCILDTSDPRIRFVCKAI